jgi:hypothetical protein
LIGLLGIASGSSLRAGEGTGDLTGDAGDTSLRSTDPGKVTKLAGETLGHFEIMGKLGEGAAEFRRRSIARSHV